MSHTPEQITAWSNAAHAGYMAALHGGSFSEALAPLQGAPGAVWRSVAMEWISTTRDITKMAAQLSGSAFQSAELIPLEGQEYSPVQLAAMRAVTAGLSGDEQDASTHFTLAWNDPANKPGELIAHVLHMCGEIALGGGDTVRITRSEPAHVTVPDDASSLEEPRG